MSSLVAVYGTLKKGYGNHRVALMDGAEFVGTAKSNELLSMYNGSFPRVKRDEGVDVEISVEIYQIPHEPVNMDILEGHPYHFKREEVLFVMDETEEAVNASLYLYQHEVREKDRIPSGVWERSKRE